MMQVLGLGGRGGSEGNPGRVGGYFQLCENIPGQDTKTQGLGFQGQLKPAPQLRAQLYCSLTSI